MTIWQQHRQYAEEMAMNGPHRGDCPFCNSKNTFYCINGDGRLEVQLLQVSL